VAGAPEQTLAAARRLSAYGQLAPGQFAAALITANGAQLGRPDAWKAELHALRRHPWADVRDAALAV